MYGKVKIALDIVLSVAALIILSPLLIITAVLIRVKLGKPILYRQTRAGLLGKPFVLLKFRTMTNECYSNGGFLPDSQRITRLGALLRKTSVDELPQLLNVIRGDMSLVGPRPLFISYLPHYSERERKRFDVKPGITGLAQVSGRNSLTWDERLELDAQYAERHSFSLDIRIIFKTVLIVFRGKGVVIVPSSIGERLDQLRSSQEGLREDSNQG